MVDNADANAWLVWLPPGLGLPRVGIGWATCSSHNWLSMTLTRLTSMGSALGLKPSVGKAEEEGADKGAKVLGRAVWRREHMRRQPEADQTASPLRRHPTCSPTHTHIA